MKEPREKKLPGFLGYRSTVTFVLATAFFAITYWVTIDRVVIAALFVVILASLMLIDTRLQRARRESALDSPTTNAPGFPEPEVLKSTVAESPDVPIPGRSPSPPAPIINEPAPSESPAQAIDVNGYRDPKPSEILEVEDSNLAEATITEAARPQALHHSDWLKVIRESYLQDFIKNAGSSVKFVIPQEASDHSLERELQDDADESEYLFVSVDAAHTRVHMVDELFHEIARQIDWDRLALDFLRNTLIDGQYRVPEDPNKLELADIAAVNGLDLGDMRAIINNRLRDKLVPYSEISDNFRQAMLRLCQTQLDPKDLGTAASQAVKEWLQGDLKFISTLQSAAIFEKIDRSNGRDMVSSLSHWLHLCGKSGLVLYLDVSRFLIDQRQGRPDGTLYYNTASVLDGYEVLRQFVDGVDELQYCLMVVSAPPEFLSDENRGVRKYDALYLRIWDEVQPKDAVNPFSALVRISSMAESCQIKQKQAVHD